jgi:hypothetical protein
MRFESDVFYGGEIGWSVIGSAFGSPDQRRRPSRETALERLGVQGG